MRRRRLAVAVGLVLITPSIAGIVAIAAGGDSVHESTPTAITTAPTRISTSTAAPPPPPSTSNPETSLAPTTSSPTTTSTAPTTTMAPIVTHDARVGVGVLTAAAAVDAPVRVEVPSIGADGPVRPGGVDASGGLEIPGDAKELVWWKYGPTPGEAGSAVIAGHLDWKRVRGVFNRLADTQPGDEVTVTYASGRTQTFVVDMVELVDKPAVAVNGTFARDGEPLLRLVTCGGDFDHDVHHYKSNVVVTAHPI